MDIYTVMPEFPIKTHVHNKDYCTYKPLCWTKGQTRQFRSSWSVVFKLQTEAWPSFTLVSSHVLIWLKNAWKSTKPAATIWPTWPSAKLQKINFSERHYESVIYWSPWCLVGVIVRAGLEVEWLWCPVRPLPPIPEFQRLTQTLD